MEWSGGEGSGVTQHGVASVVWKHRNDNIQLYKVM